MAQAYFSTPDQYFATLPTEELLDECEKRRADYEDFCLRTSRLTRWRMSYETYMRAENKIGIKYGGDRGQYKLLSSNIFRSVVTGLVSVITNQRPAYEPMVVNDDHKSLAQDLVAKGIIDYYLKVGKLEDLYRQAVLLGLLTGEGWLYERWDADEGQIVDVVTAQDGTQNPVKEGDLRFSVIGPQDLIRDYTRMDMQNDWYIIREYKNKWDLIAQRPDLEDDLKGLTITGDLQRFRFGHILDSHSSMMDIIPVYTFVHAKTKALPKGRIVQYVDNKTFILDTALPYDEIPLYPLLPDVEPYANFGATVMTSLVNLQYAYDKTLSIILTNQQTFGVQNIVVDDNTNIKPTQVVEGLNFIKTNLSKGIPQALQLCSTPAEIFNFLDRIESQMEKLAGLPSILRGQPPQGVSSGTALAYLQAQALVFNSPLQQSYISMLEHSATGIINMLKTFATTKRMSTISGKSKQQYMQEFTGQDLDGISRVIVNAGNPVVSTEAGKLQVAQDLMQKGLVNLQEYFQVLETGTIDPMIESNEKELMLIREENEQLANGVAQVVLPGHNHPLHIKEHNAVLMNPTLLKNATNNPIIASTLMHIQHHIDAMTPGNPACNPQLLAILGIQPLPPQQMPAGMAPAAPGAPQGGPTPPAAGAPTNAPVAKPRAPNLPKGSPSEVGAASQQISAPGMIPK